MKYSIPLICFLVLISCTENQRVRTALNQAESCLSTAPDSALALVQGIDEQSLSTKGLRARHALLLTMALDKCYFDVSEDSTIRVAYDYYKYHGSKRNRLLSIYYLGVVQQNGGEYINAALSFREAEPLAEELEDYRQLSLIEQHLSRIFAMNYDHVRALDYAERAEKAAEQAADSLMAGYCQYDMAAQLLSEFRNEEAEAILSHIILHGKKNQVLYSMSARKLAEVCLLKSRPNLERAESLYHNLDSLGVRYIAHDYGIMALISEMENNSVQADNYLRAAWDRLNTSVDSLVYYNDCRNVYDCRKDWEKAHFAKTKSVRIQDRVIIELLSHSVTHAMESYYSDSLVIERIRSRSRLLSFGFIGVVLLTLIVWMFFLLRKKNQQLLEDMVRIQEVNDEMNHLRLGESAISQIIDQLIADKVKSLQQLSESFFSWEETAIKKREIKKGALLPDEIIGAFRMQLGKLRNDHSFISSLEQSLNLTSDGIMDKARQCLHSEKETDYSVLILLFSGFSIKSISYLLRMSEVSLRMRKTRFKQQFEAMQEPFRSLFLEKLGY